ncbi:unnamed protein product [Rotaria socialis]
MTSQIESLPNEILRHIFYHLSWSDMLTSLWSLNIRFNSLVCSILSRSDQTSNSGILITRGLSYNKYYSILFPLIINSLSLSSSIQRIHFDETNSISCDLIYEWLFNEKKIFHFPNLKSFILTQCGSIEPAVLCLSYLIEHQLDELTLTFDQEMILQFSYEKQCSRMISDTETERQIAMMGQLLCKIFSAQCQLKTLRLDISNVFKSGRTHQCLESKPYLSSDSTQHELQSYCMTLRYLYIRLNQTCFLENLIEHVPNLEQLSVEFHYLPKFECQLSLNDIEKIIDSFKIHSFFISHQWTNVKCLFDPIMSCQHLFSSFSNTLKLPNNLINQSYVFNWPNIDKLSFRLHPSLYLFLQEFNDLSPNIRCIKVYKNQRKDFDDSDLLMSLNSLSEMKQYKKVDMAFRNVTKIQFGTWFDRHSARVDEPIDRNEVREKVLAHLISMTVQLKYLLVEQFEWLLHVVQYTSYELRTNALSSVRYAEFCLPSCHYGFDKANHIGKHLVPFISTYMPRLQTLRLWRPDDFPWTSIRPDNGIRCTNVSPLIQWIKSLETSESIAQHVNVFQQDLCQLVERLKEFTFLDIYGTINYEKVQAYRLMIQTCFPHSRNDVKVSRFRLWF